MKVQSRKSLRTEGKRISMLLARYAHPHSSVAFWHTKIGPVFYPFSTYQDYYIDFTAKLKYRGPHDAEGLPLLDYFGTIGIQYNPTAVGQWGLGAWSDYKRVEGKDYSRERFIRAANWLSRNLEVDHSGRGFWLYRFGADGYGSVVSAQSPPWASGLAQSRGISMLVRAWREGINLDARELVRCAAKGMMTSVDQGGLCRRFNGNVVIEESVVERPQAVLDGIMFAILGLQDYCFLEAGDRPAKELLQETVDSLARLLPQYELGSWSRADLFSQEPPMPASLFYHELHVHQLRVLYALYGLPIFFNYAARWQSYLDSVVKRNVALVRKAVFKLRHY